MAINFAPTTYIDSLSLPSTERGLAEAKKLWSGIPTSDKITGVELRLSRVYIIDNKQAYIPWIVRYSDLYLLLVAADNLGGGPQTVTIKGFADVDDSEELPAERTAYYWKGQKAADKPPGQIHFVCSVIKSNEGIRDTGSALKQLQKSQDYSTVLQSVVNAISSGGATAIGDSLLALTGVLGSILGDIDDTPLITTVMSFTDIGGDFDKLGRTPWTKKNRYAEIGATLIVRDKNREI